MICVLSPSQESQAGSIKQSENTETGKARRVILKATPPSHEKLPWDNSDGERLSKQVFAWHDFLLHGREGEEGACERERNR